MKLTSPLFAALFGACCLPLAVHADNPATPAKPQPAAASKPSVPAAKSAATPAVPPQKIEAKKPVASKIDTTAPRHDTAAVPKAAPITRKIGKLDWHTDYSAAYEAARAGKKMLLIVFHDDRQRQTANSFETSVLAQPSLQRQLNNVVRVSLPMSTLQPVAAAPVAKPAATPEKAGKEVAAKPAPAPAKPGRLIDHYAFEFMYGESGIAMLDLTDRRSPHYGKVVSAHPFSDGNVQTLNGVSTILNLPKGTVTQRALTFAVLMYAAPISTTGGQCNDACCEAARQGSALMAQYGSVGHHDWGSRSNNVTAMTGRGASEVAAMGGGTLQQAAAQCVTAWQGSPAHWGIMSTPQTIYGYDLVQAPGGGWYGTGVFGN